MVLFAQYEPIAGAPLALLDAVFLSLHLPEAPISIIGYGMPRVGNQDFANFVNARFPVKRINNQKDPVPTVPGESLGYVHTSGEVHIIESGAFESCPGPDNTNLLCTAGDVPNIFAGRLADHDGPYNGVTMGC
ncbi:hypothetical protein APHAL10511_005231 [Amanita phalloides]|nr:hypothetical protein APHAL10511_005231 [Amanita phalloides]